MFSFNKPPKPPEEIPLHALLESAKFEYLDCVKKIDPIALRKGDRLTPMFRYAMEIARIPGLSPMKVLIEAGGIYVAPKDMQVNFVRMCLFQYEGSISVYESFPPELEERFVKLTKEPQL